MWMRFNTYDLKVDSLKPPLFGFDIGLLKDFEGPLFTFRVGLLLAFGLFISEVLGNQIIVMIQGYSRKEYIKRSNALTSKAKLRKNY